MMAYLNIICKLHLFVKRWIETAYIHSLAPPVVYQARSQGGFGGFDRTPHFGECILRSTVSTLYATRVWPETEFTYTQYRAM